MERTELHLTARSALVYFSAPRASEMGGAGEDVQHQRQMLTAPLIGC